jgi:hypothetical protein
VHAQNEKNFYLSHDRTVYSVRVVSTKTEYRLLTYYKASLTQLQNFGHHCNVHEMGYISEFAVQWFVKIK